MKEELRDMGWRARCLGNIKVWVAERGEGTGTQQERHPGQLQKQRGLGPFEEVISWTGIVRDEPKGSKVEIWPADVSEIQIRMSPSRCWWSQWVKGVTEPGRVCRQHVCLGPALPISCMWSQLPTPKYMQATFAHVCLGQHSPQAHWARRTLHAGGELGFRIQFTPVWQSLGSHSPPCTLPPGVLPEPSPRDPYP